MAAIIAPLTMSDGMISFFHLVSTEDGRWIHP